MQHWVTRYFDDFEVDPSLLNSLVNLEGRLADKIEAGSASGGGGGGGADGSGGGDARLAQGLARLQNARTTRTPSRTVQLRRPTRETELGFNIRGGQ